jgi:hypothetical protein
MYHEWTLQKLDERLPKNSLHQWVAPLKSAHQSGYHCRDPNFQKEEDTSVGDLQGSNQECLIIL